MKSLKSFKVLVVEDDVDYNAILSDLLESECAKVFSAENGQVALDILAKEEIDFVVSDVQMPVLGGAELVKNIRAKHPTIPIVLLTTGHSQLSQQEALGFGANGLIHKPFSFEALVNMINELSAKNSAA